MLGGLARCFRCCRTSLPTGMLSPRELVHHQHHPSACSSENRKEVCTGEIHRFLKKVTFSNHYYCSAEKIQQSHTCGFVVDGWPDKLAPCKMFLHPFATFNNTKHVIYVFIYVFCFSMAMIVMLVNLLVTWSIGHSLTHSLNQSVTRSIIHPVFQHVILPVNLSIRQSIFAGIVCVCFTQAT